VKKLKKSFSVLFEKFTRKKSFFEQKIEVWKQRGKTTWYERGKILLEQLEKEGQEIKEMFGDASASVGRAAIKSRIKLFKKIFKQLDESTKPVWRQWLEALVIAGTVALLLRHFIFGLYHVPTGSAEPTILVGDRVWGNKLAYRFSSIKRGDLVIFDNPIHRYKASNSLSLAWQKYVGLPIPLLGVPAGPINVVKRVIAVPGDWIEGRIEDGKTVVYRNNEKLNELYVNTLPLIWLKKTAGFIPPGLLGPLPIPPFLQKRPVPNGVRYTYDPAKSFEDQPYYNMERSEVISVPGYSTLTKALVPAYKDVNKTDCADTFGPMRVPKGKYWVMGDSRQNSQDSRWFGFLDESLIHGRLSFIIYSIDSQEPIWLFELIKHPISFWFRSIRWSRWFKRPDY